MPTFKSLPEKGNVLVELIEEFVERVAKPLHKELIMLYEGKRIRPKQYSFNRDNWEKARKMFLEGRITHFHLCCFEKEIWQSDSDINPMSIDMRIDSGYEYPGSAGSIEFSVAKWLYGEKTPEYLQYAFVEMLEELYKSLQGVSGFVTLDGISAGYSLSPHEIHMGILGGYTSVSMQFHRYYRGYFWGNFLNPVHVKLLGGLERVADEAPVYKTKKLADGGMFLQLTNDIDNVTDEDLRRLKCYLRSILPPKQTEQDPRSYYKLRVIEDECTD